MLKFLPLILFVFVFSSCSVVRFAKLYGDSDTGKEGKLSGNIYRTEKTTYRIGKLSDGWELVESDRGDIFFWNNSKKATITVNSVCDENKIKYNLKALSDSLVTGIKDKKMINSDKVSIAGTDALYTEYQGIYNGYDIGIATIVLKKQKCVYDFSYSAGAKNFNNLLEEYLEFTSDFEVLDR